MEIDESFALQKGQLFNLDGREATFESTQIGENHLDG